MSHECHEERVIERYAEACSVLDDPRYLVPEVDSTTGSGTVDWLRASVSRFCNGVDHDRRRAMVEADLARIDTGWLERAAHERTLAELRPSPRPPGLRGRWVHVARAVPVATLASSGPGSRRSARR